MDCENLDLLNHKSFLILVPDKEIKDLLESKKNFYKEGRNTGRIFSAIKKCRRSLLSMVSVMKIK
jgi:hypothetical protein